MKTTVSIGLGILLLTQLAFALPERAVELPGISGISGVSGIAGISGVSRAPRAPDASGRTVRLGPDDDLQEALNRAVSGDVIELQAGAVFYGPFVLRPHPGSGWVTIISRSDAQHPLPPAGTRVTPADVSAMASLVATTGSVISTAAAASRYHFIGVEVRPGQRDSILDQVLGGLGTLTTLVDLGAGNNSADNMPHHIVFERSYLHGDPVLGTRRGIAMNGAHLAVIDSHLADFKSMEDSQAVGGWEGSGPFLLHNNYLEAAGENVMFGGADPSIKERIPADITVTGNHFAKPLSWRRADPTHDGSNWTVKNLLELKSARRVLIDGNLFEHHWPQAQNGFAILFTVRNQDGDAPWSQVEDVTFSNNIVRRVAAGINILGYDDNHKSRRTQHVHIRNNLFHDIGGDWGSGVLLQLLNSPAHIQFTHNTSLQSNALLRMDGDPIPAVDFRWNIFMDNSVGISGTNTAPGQHSIDTYLGTPVTIAGNVLIGSGDHDYPSGITRVDAINSMPFTDPARADFRLQAESASVIADFAEVPGVDFTALCSALSTTERPVYC
ncbi:MAG: hypothetical protein Q7V56_09285 [Gammaproteobacteria bacterium]|nr:hypothetical protein [Gammaproteobacteria bacterium]